MFNNKVGKRDMHNHANNTNVVEPNKRKSLDVKHLLSQVIVAGSGEHRRFEESAKAPKASEPEVRLPTKFTIPSVITNMNILEQVHIPAYTTSIIN